VALLIRPGVLAVAAATAAALAACYQPTLRDCAVSCAGASDCAGDQVCGSDGWCAAPDVAGRCDQIDASTVDGGGGGDGVVDAPIGDASTDAPVDAAATLRIVITGRGTVVTDLPLVECSGPPGDCSFPAMPGVMVTLTATATPGHPFVAWTTPNCNGNAGPSCTVTISAPVTLVGAEFD
jgi:hypothetical protein